MLLSDLDPIPGDRCPWCDCKYRLDDDIDERDHIEGVGSINYGTPAFCCVMDQQAEEACEALAASDRANDEALAAAAVAYWPELSADLPVIRQRMTHDRPFSGEVAHG
jgi:hypothetical protein